MSLCWQFWLCLMFWKFSGANGGRTTTVRKYGALGAVIFSLCHNIAKKNGKTYWYHLFNSISLNQEFKTKKKPFVGTTGTNRMKSAEKIWNILNLS